MLRFHSRFWTCLLFSVGHLLQCGDARVLTEVQAGPLYRMVGSRLSISCNVSGFVSVSSQKEFEFRVTKPAKSTVLNIISTGDPDFGYSVYRMRSNDIALTHVSPNSVLFEIQSLRKDDEGEYDCAVINPDAVYDGTYSATTVVKVIDNSLSVSSPVTTSLRFNEGESLALTCQASSNTLQHTHLSVAWYLRKGDEDNARLIMSLDRDFTLRSGQEFQGRYQAGLIRLDKLGEATYRLAMDQLEVSDRGRVYCLAQEWIQDPDLSWYSLTQKTTLETSLDVKGNDLSPDGASLVVRLSAQPTSLQEGQELLLTCSVDTQKLEERFFSVAWLHAGVELARIGPTGVLSVKPEYSRREKQGELRASRIGDREYRLVLQPVSADDQGGYTCRAWPQERGQHGTFVQGAAQDSNALLVSIPATASGLSVEMQNSARVNEGDRTTLTCRVHGFKSQLSVAWQRKVTSTVAFTSVASLSPEGVVETAAEFTNQVRLTRPEAGVFILELIEVALADSGVYQCVVSEWNGGSKTTSQSRTTMLTVAPTDSFVVVRLISRSNNVTVGDNVELMCRVKGPRLPVAVTWILQRGPSATTDNILTLYSDGAVSWFVEQHRYQLRIENTPGERIYFLLINGASHREAGSYQCQVSVFQKNVYKKLPPSNPTTFMVQIPESDLTLTSSPALTKNVSSDISIKCSGKSSRSGSCRHAVTWILQKEGQNITIASSDLDSSVTYGPMMDAVHSHRISIQQTKGPSFELTIRSGMTSDQGTYICEVVEWLQDPRGEWYRLTPVSGTTRLTLIEPANDLRLDTTEKWVTAREGDEVQLKCDLISNASRPFLFYKITWFHTRSGSPSVSGLLLQLDHTGLLRYPRNQGLHGLQGRLRPSRETPSSFGLAIQMVHERDSGTYQCRVEQYQFGDKGHWQQKASVDGGPIMLSVNVTGEKEALSGSASGTVIGVLAAVVVCSLLVLLVLALKLKRAKTSEQKSDQSLWVEQHPLATKHNTDD